jgi:predicted 2-oxoglutarate/Fe(II)-dependent dioxygenase YbiX
MKAYKLFTEQEAKELAASVTSWEPGKASNDSTVNKRNEESKEGADRVLERLLGSVIPKLHFVQEVSPPKFNRYRDGGEYGSHSDSSQMHGVRTDLACTLFLSDGYEGGELCVAGHEVKLSPGECIVYECWRPHFVKPVTKGERIAAIWWMQSYIRSEEQRDLLGMLRSVIGETKDEQHFAKLGAVHEKLTKMWWS